MTRCLLDKVVARYLLQGLLKMSRGQELLARELLCVDLFGQSSNAQLQLCISPATEHVLGQIAQTPKYEPLIRFFTTRVMTLYPTRYFKRWSRRLKELGFSREDAAILALATFGTDETEQYTSAAYVATADLPLIRHWETQYEAIEKRFSAMQNQLPEPYCHFELPEVLLPEQMPLSLRKT